VEAGTRNRFWTTLRGGLLSCACAPCPAVFPLPSIALCSTLLFSPDDSQILQKSRFLNTRKDGIMHRELLNGF
jgi:hypothetical protein